MAHGSVANIEFIEQTQMVANVSLLYFKSLSLCFKLANWKYWLVWVKIYSKYMCTTKLMRTELETLKMSNELNIWA